MKTFLIILAIVLLGAITYFIKRNHNFKMQSNSEPVNIEFYSLNDGNQDVLIYNPKLDKKLILEINNKYSWDNFELGDNIFEQYTYKLFDTLENIAGKGISDRVFFNNLTRGQKMYHCLLRFNWEISNGGVYQFFFNNPQLSFAMLETFDELKLSQLKNDYEKCLDEFIGSSGSYYKRKEIFNNSTINMNERWKKFAEGYCEIPSAEIIANYYYDEKYELYVYKTFVDYVNAHLEQFSE